jgi:diguanylate cyclase (GGDEF)-like protein
VVTISVGVATTPDLAAPDGQALLNRADQALYEAKRTGRNRIAVVDAPATPVVQASAS